MNGNARLTIFRPSYQTILQTKIYNRPQSFFVAKTQNEEYSNVRPFEEIPGPIDLPIIGTLWQYKLGILSAFEYHKSLDKLHVMYGPICRQNLAGNRIVCIFDPDDFRTIFKLDGKSPYIKPLQETVGLARRDHGKPGGLGNTNGEEWLTLRAALRPLMLRVQEVASFLPQTEKAATALVRRLDVDRTTTADGSVPKLREVVGKWLQESAGYAAFDRSLGCFDGGKSEETADKLMDASREIAVLAGQLNFSLPIYKFIRTPKYRRLTKAEVFFNETTKRHVEDTISNVRRLVSGGELGDRYSFMSYLLSHPEISFLDIIQTTHSLIADGLTTTRPAFLSALHNLATNPEAQENAYKEVKEVLGDAEVVTKSMLGRLSYVKAAVKETFRLHPIGTEISRIVQQDTVLSNYRIPKGTHLNLVPNVNFRKAQLFPAPEKFIPERWLRGSSADVHPYILNPFGHGPRVCAGKRFAEQDLLVGLAKVLQRFELRHPDNESMEFVVHTLITHKHPVRVQFIPRR